MKKIIIILLILIVAGVPTGFFVKKKFFTKKKEEYKLVEVKKGSIVEKALAVGKIEPKKEIAVKSIIPGIVKTIHAEVGEIINRNVPLFEISPNPTPNEYADVKMNVNMMQVEFENAKSNHERITKLSKKNLVSKEDLDKSQREYEQAKLRLDLARDKLSLLEKGRVSIANQKIDNIIKSPINGMVLERKVEEGDPVVPLTSYQAGTELMILADMENLIFKGTVDEIDVGKLHEGMGASISVGALPGRSVEGVITKIAPKAKVEQNATLFDIEIKLELSDTVLLRAGYSANADIIIQKKDSIPIIPERLVTFRGDSSFVEIEKDVNKPEEKYVKLGISDGIQIEILDGLALGEKIVERPPKKVE